VSSHWLRAEPGCKWVCSLTPTLSQRERGEEQKPLPSGDLFREIPRGVLRNPLENAKSILMWNSLRNSLRNAQRIFLGEEL